MALPSSPFDVTKSLVAGKSVIVFTPTGASAITFESKKIDNNLPQTEDSIDIPDADGVDRPARTWISKEEEVFVFESPEPRRLLDIFSGSLAGRSVGTVTLYVPDIDDASGFCALVSETFAATVTRNGNATIQSSKGTVMALQIKSNKAGRITWTANAAV